jgi:hypothetical protein
MLARAVVLAVVVLAGCEGLARSDARLSTPERTVATLLGAYGLEDVPQEEIRARLASRGRFELHDRASFELCFSDLDGPVAEGLAGWVVGALAAGRDDVRTEIAHDRATVSPREGVRIVMHRGADGWRIALRESVPEDVQRGMASLAEHAHARALRTGTAALE